MLIINIHITKRTKWKVPHDFKGHIYICFNESGLYLLGLLKF